MELKLEHLIIGVLILYVYAQTQQPATIQRDTGGVVVTDACAAGCFGLTDSDLQIRTKEHVNGSSISAQAAHSLYTNNNVLAKAASTITAYPHSYATLPTCFDGYLISGKDNGSAPDYYFKKTPVSWTCDGTPVLDDVIYITEESTITFTGYDDGTSESTWNISVGTTKVTSAELKIESAADKCIGNPNINRPIAICINGTASTIGKFNEIKPTGVSKTVSVPGFLSSATNVLKCYELPTPALCDGAFYRFYLTIDPVSDPGATESVSVFLLDKTLYENDDKYYVEGWEDSSDIAADTDIGITASNLKQLAFS